jgi:multicomponent Na+:H+ antiporter subunit B
MNRGESMIFAMVVKGLFLVLNLFALYLLLRGHNLPGGGFIAGLGSAISLIMLRLALGWLAVERLVRVDPARMAFWGLVLAVVTASAPMLWGRPFFEHRMWHWPLPWVGEWHVGSTLAFDTGVYLVVVGIVAKMIFTLSRSSEGSEVFNQDEQSRYASSIEEPIEATVVAGRGSGKGGGMDAG